MKCPSLNYVYNMTWAEFNIRLFSYNRIEQKDWFKIREMAYASFIGSHVDAKKIKGMTKQKFMPLEADRKNSIINRKEIEKKIKEAQTRYKERKK